jgi:hypothetical protein
MKARSLLPVVLLACVFVSVTIVPLNVEVASPCRSIEVGVVYAQILCDVCNYKQRCRNKQCLEARLGLLGCSECISDHRYCED